MLACARLSSLRHIITSRAFLERFKLDLEPLRRHGLEIIFLEEARQFLRPPDKLAAWARARWRPRRVLRRQVPEATAVVLFTSGSEGMPKGVELTHVNLLANVRQMMCVIDMLDTDRFFNALPLFHSFGLTVGTLLPLTRGMYVFLYPSRSITGWCRRRFTILIAP